MCALVTGVQTCALPISYAGTAASFAPLMEVPVSVEVPVELLLPAAKAAASAPASPPANGPSHDRNVESKVPSVVADWDSTHAGRPHVLTALSSPTPVTWFRTIALSWMEPQKV